MADKAIEMKIGARGLRSVMEGVMTDVMYTVPSDSTVSKVVITADCVKKWHRARDNSRCPLIFTHSGKEKL